MIHRFAVVVAAIAAPYCLGAEPHFASHPPMRPLPTPVNRPLPESPLRFVDAAKGNDANDGSKERPWKSLAHAVKQLQPGNTLCLRGGTFYEQVVASLEGEPRKPITIRSYPGEAAVIDGGLREFFEEPATAWEPFPSGSRGEYRSVKAYPGLGGAPDDVTVLGHFGDSMIPLHGYRFLSDLRSDNVYWNLASTKVGEDKHGIYCGPGVYCEPQSGRIHVRLMPTKMPYFPPSENYTGETDPRKLPLVISRKNSGPTMTMRRCNCVRLQDLVVRGSRLAAIEISESSNIAIDGLTAYGGASAIQIRDTHGFRMTNTACRGIAAPWTFRGSLKYRAIEARIFSASGWDPTGADNRDFEIANCEFTDCVDGVFLGNVRGVKFHHNLVDNVSDDAIFLTAGTAPDGTTHGGDVHIYQNLLSRNLTTFAFGVGHGRQKAIEGGKQTGTGVHVYRNVFDFRKPVPYHQPTSASEPPMLTSYGRVASDHGSPTWEPMHFYHNTVMSAVPAFRDYYGAGLGGHMGGGAKRRVFNNIFVQDQGMPGAVFSPGSDFQADGNLHWSISQGRDYHGDFLQKFRNSNAFRDSKKLYPPGWTAHDRFADPQFIQLEPDGRRSMDLRLREGSPAVNAGVGVDATWPDPLRDADAGRPDAGVLPLGAAPWHVGVQGRLTMFGEEKKPSQPLQLPAEKFVAMPRSERKPVAIVEGYPAFDEPIVRFAFRKHGFPVESFERTWLDPKDYSKYGCVVLVGDLARAKIEPNRYSAADLVALRKYLEGGGTLLLMRGRFAAFATPEGRQFVESLVGAIPKANGEEQRVHQPNHPWVKHLETTKAPAWLQARSAVPFPARLADSLLGSRTGMSTLAQYRVGKGQVVYVGWELAASLPNGRQASTLELEKAFEDQTQIILNIVSEMK